MSRYHRCREQLVSSHWEPESRPSYSYEYSQRHYRPSTAELRPRGRFSDWRDDIGTSSTSSYPQRSHRRESYSDQWREGNGRRSWHAESSYPSRRQNFEPGRDRDDWDLRRSIEHHRDASRQRHATYSPRPTIRAKTPVESIPPPPPAPSSEYLSLAKNPSEILRDPATIRKLLVVDLNGTLLVRSARSRTASGPQLRSVQPRPYMQSFRDYLFCLETKSWLDTMVWSSAQPHSVDDMVNKVFGTAKVELKAVWNRKSLGLSEEDYHRKAVTTKDLAKPWALFASALSPIEPNQPSSVPPQSQTVHSALTTVLLDDSFHKAALQPYNHVCIPAYDSTRRQHDLQSFLTTNRDPQKKRKSQAEIPASPSDQTTSQLLAIDILTGFADREGYDTTLLAVIGILETLKLQSNVAGWIRQGGLWATQERGVEGHHNAVKTMDCKTASSTVIRTGNDASTSDSIATPEEASLQLKMWFEDSSTMSSWVARGRRTLVELGIQAVHGVTG